MLSFEEFQEYAQQNLAEALPEGYENVKISLNTVKKNNGRELHALTVLPEGQNIAPNIYLEGFYMEYEFGTGIDKIMSEIAEVCRNNLQPSEEFANIAQDFRNFDFVKEKIVMVAVNREKNLELLRDIPHTNREDLALIYKVLLKSEKNGIGTITIHNGHLEMWDISVEEVHELAMKNTKELLPVTVRPMTEVLQEMFVEADRERGMYEEMLDDIPAEEMMYVIANESKVNGAASIFYDDVLFDLAERLGSNLYILPSSVHECLALSADKSELEQLRQMVCDVNEGMVELEEQLSDNVYYYDAKAHTLSLATEETVRNANRIPKHHR